MKIKEIFLQSWDGFRVQDFEPITKNLCLLPKFFSTHLFRHIDKYKTHVVTCDMFEEFVTTVLLNV